MKERKENIKKERKTIEKRGKKEKKVNRNRKKNNTKKSIPQGYPNAAPSLTTVIGRLVLPIGTILPLVTHVDLVDAGVVIAVEAAVARG